MLIKWDDSFLVQVEDIDYQHKKLVGIVNNLAESMADGKGKNALAAILGELVSYTRVHFETEEQILRRINYPDFEQHQKEHSDFVEKVCDFQIKFDRGQLGLTIEIMNFLCDWVRNHIKNSDKQYAQFMDNHGLR